MSTELENKLSAARTRLILDKPFLGALVLRLPLVECPASILDFLRYAWVIDSTRLETELRFRFKFSSHVTLQQMLGKQDGGRLCPDSTDQPP